MIFVTVGTHEQPFTRLVEYMDKWAETHDEEVVIQSGFSTYEPTHCKWQHFYHQYEMSELLHGSYPAWQGADRCSEKT